MISKPGNLLDEHELRLVALRCFLRVLAASVVMFILTFHLTKNIVGAEITFAGGCLASIYYAVMVLKRDWLDEKIGLFDSSLPGFSYQGIVLLLCTLSIFMSFAFFSLAWYQGGIYSAIATGLWVNFASVFMLLRLDVYNNKSRLLYVGEKDGQKCYDQVIGYHPVFYYILGLSHGWGPLGISFRRILEAIFLHNGSLVYTSLCFILCFIVGCFILSPDIANNVLPFEIRTTGGLIKFLLIGLILMGISCIPLI